MKQSKKIFALGFFDGVHLGHQALLNVCVTRAKQGEMIPCAITFGGHPQSLFQSDPPALINTAEDRQRLLRQYGIVQISVYPVTKEVMSTTWQDFLEELIKVGAAGFVCGYDFRFGRGGKGTAQKIRQFCAERGMTVEIVPEQIRDGVRISSTYIRSLIERGDVKTAAEFMGHRHILSGEVVQGRQLGRTIGVPTANILIPDGVVVPKHGVYACVAEAEGQKFAAVTNIGSRPTVGGHQVRAESWLMDFDGDLYGKKLTLEFAEFLRPEQKFNSLEELKQQIHLDVEKTTEIL